MKGVLKQEYHGPNIKSGKGAIRSPSKGAHKENISVLHTAESIPEPKSYPSLHL